jgi:protein ImuB
MGFGVERIVLTAACTRRVAHRQWDMEEKHAPGTVPAPGARSLEPGASSSLMDELVSRLGPDHVLLIQGVATHIPERTFRSRSVMAPPESSEHQPRALVEFPGADRPSLLLPEPEPIRVLDLADGRPQLLIWRAQEHRILTASGPERITPEWWRAGNKSAQRKPALTSAFRLPPSAFTARDYFTLADDRGQWLWVYRELDSNRWFVHGQWA